GIGDLDFLRATASVEIGSTLVVSLIPRQQSLRGYDTQSVLLIGMVPVVDFTIENKQYICILYGR
ncbi:MAG: hypothetical protein WCG60_01660, partial [bacterium]